MANDYQLTVKSNQSISPNMREIVLTAPSLSEFPEVKESGYVKTAFPQENGKRLLRSYTIRNFDAENLTLTLHCADQSLAGPGSEWVKSCQPGDSVTVVGPGETRATNHDADWFLIAGDLSALPAIAVTLEKLPADAKGYAIIEVPHEDDKQDLKAPSNIDVQWIINPDHQQANIELLNTLKTLEWLPGIAYPWFAGEFEGMRKARKFLVEEKGIKLRDMYLSCYWKFQDTNEGMKRAKRIDKEENEQ